MSGRSQRVDTFFFCGPVQDFLLFVLLFHRLSILGIVSFFHQEWPNYPWMPWAIQLRNNSQLLLISFDLTLLENAWEHSSKWPLGFGLIILYKNCVSNIRKSKSGNAVCLMISFFLRSKYERCFKIEKISGTLYLIKTMISNLLQLNWSVICSPVQRFLPNTHYNNWRAYPYYPDQFQTDLGI
jgi:hypothetical protein